MITTSPAPVLTDEQRAEMHDLYRHLHANPELSMQEHRTAALIQAELERAGLETFVCGGTGVVGVLRNGEGPVVAFRADTDGLPIREDTGVPYASTATGTLDDGTEVPVMHGCGHDTHAATLLTAAKVLAGSTDRWSGTVVLIFQPGEETAAGARAMVEDGLWDRAPKPEVVYGQHVMPGLAGTIQYASGHTMTQADSWKVTLLGRQSHGSQPQDSIDPIVLGAHIITRIQTIVSREIDPRRAAVVTVGSFHSGLKENIIPADAEFTLNIRTFDDAVRAKVLGALRRVIRAEAEASNAPEPLIEELYTFPKNYNDPQATSDVVEALRRELGEGSVNEIEPLMGSEDFGLLAESIGVPSVFWFFGGHTEETLAADPVPMNHSPFFAPAMEPTLSTGVQAALAAILSKVGV
ncbi:hippurate hydrolase [Arthrobacter subterraneus]|uniref:Hippurate hydrolase n=1 Tax=Arthrobacter subterraneus TaxID=335973 RepID=A0A1G8MDG3_9MICC|nr:amidohydrolase [Arthrobacter subterraneus]SDI65944.1 hippurate hydrolase [Arthrobacter subterraneus]